MKIRVSIIVDGGNGEQFTSDSTDANETELARLEEILRSGDLKNFKMEQDNKTIYFPGNVINNSVRILERR